jgi:FkbM family methyltransferase
MTTTTHTTAQPYTLHSLTFNATEEGAGAFHVFNPTRPEATDSGPGGMVCEMERFVQLCRGRTRLVDVGALFGVFSLVFTAMSPDARALAVEPSPWAYPVLLEQCRANPKLNILASNLFLGDTHGRHVRCVRDWKHVIGNLPSDGREEAALTEWTLDGLDLDFVNCDVMKIDVEAYECQVLRGARGLIARCKPLIFLEAHCNNLADNGETPEGLAALVRDLGYRMELLDGRPLESFEGLDMVRVVCWPREGGGAA